MKGTEIGIWVDQFDFSSATSQVELQFEVPEAECTNMDSQAQEFIPLLPKATLTQNGYFQGVLPNGFEAELNARFATGHAIVTVLAGRSVPACVAYMLPDAQDYEMKFGSPINNLITLNGKWGTANGARRGLRCFDGTLTTTGAQASVDFGAGVTTGGKAVLHVKSITGAAANAGIKVKSSPDGSTWSDEGAFTFSAVGSYSVDLTGIVDRYIQIECTSLGGATAIRCMAVVSLG